MPPTTNHLFGTCFRTKRRYKTQEYKDWVRVAEKELLAQKRLKISGDEWLEADYKFYFPIYNKDGSKKKKDTFNYEKALSDFLSDNITGFEDKKILDGRVRKIHSERNEVEIVVRETKE